MKKENRELKREHDFFKLALAHFVLARRASACGRSGYSRKASVHEFTTTGKEFKQRLVKKNITCSISGKGNCWDNAVVESFLATLKDELEILDGLI